MLPGERRPVRRGAVRTPVARSALVLALSALLLAGGAAAEPRPYGHDAGTDGAIATAGLLGFGVGWLAQRDFVPLTDAERLRLDASALNRLDRTAVDNWSPGAARASDLLVAAAAAAPLTLLLSDAGSDQAGTIGVMYLETALLNTGLTYLLKSVVGRTRPYMYSDDPRIPAELRLSPTSRRSFPSGHTANAFCAMVFLASVHGQLLPDSDAGDWIWGGCLATAATVGYLRYAAGMHFPTDIVAGAALGAFAGWVVPVLHEDDLAPAGPEAPGAVGRRQRPVVVGLTLGF